MKKMIVTLITGIITGTVASLKFADYAMKLDADIAEHKAEDLSKFDKTTNDELGEIPFDKSEQRYAYALKRKLKRDRLVDELNRELKRKYRVLGNLKHQHVTIDDNEVIWLPVESTYNSERQIPVPGTVCDFKYWETLFSWGLISYDEFDHYTNFSKRFVLSDDNMMDCWKDMDNIAGVTEDTTNA